MRRQVRAINPGGPRRRVPLPRAMPLPARTHSASGRQSDLRRHGGLYAECLEHGRGAGVSLRVDESASYRRVHVGRLQQRRLGDQRPRPGRADRLHRARRHLDRRLERGTGDQGLLCPQRRLASGQHLHQYEGGHDETYGGVQLNIDGRLPRRRHGGHFEPDPRDTFVELDGTDNVFRIAGGAPLYVSDWSAFGGPQPAQQLTPRQFSELAPYPANGTFLTTTTGLVYRIAGGAPILVTDWDLFGTVQPSVTVDEWDLLNMTNPLAHLRPYPLTEPWSGDCRRSLTGRLPLDCGSRYGQMRLRSPSMTRGWRPSPTTGAETPAVEIAPRCVVPDAERVERQRSARPLPGRDSAQAADLVPQPSLAGHVAVSRCAHPPPGQLSGQSRPALRGLTHMRTYVRMTSDGSPYARFRRALETGNELLVLERSAGVPGCGARGRIAHLPGAARRSRSVISGRPSAGLAASRSRRVRSRSVTFAQRRPRSTSPVRSAEAMEQLQRLCVACGVS